MSDIENLNEFLTNGKIVRIEFSKHAQLKSMLGLIEEILEDKIKFSQITNEYEYFSNISDPPIYKEHYLKRKDINAINEY